GLSTIRGVEQSVVESTISESFHTQGAVEIVYKATPTAKPEQTSTTSDSPTVIATPEDTSTPLIDNEISSPQENNIKSQQEIIQNEFTITKEERVDFLKVVFNKMNLVSESISFYFYKFLYPVEQYFFYDQAAPTLTQKTLELLTLFLIFTCCILTFIKNKSEVNLNSIYPWLILFVCFWLPVSGIFYVPFMKYSLYADHWAYLMVLPLAIILYNTISYIHLRFLNRFTHSFTIVLFSMPIAFFIIKTSF